MKTKGASGTSRLCDGSVGQRTAEGLDLPAVLQMPDPKIQIDEVCRAFEDFIHPTVEGHANVLRSVRFRAFGQQPQPFRGAIRKTTAKFVLQRVLGKAILQ